MNEKRFEVIDDGFSKWIVDTTLTEDKHEGAIYTAYDMCRKLNELYEENEQLKCINDQLEERLENSGIGVALKMDCDKELQKSKKSGWDSEPNTDYVTRAKEGLK